MRPSSLARLSLSLSRELERTEGAVELLAIDAEASTRIIAEANNHSSLFKENVDSDLEDDADADLEEPEVDSDEVNRTHIGHARSTLDTCMRS